MNEDNRYKVIDKVQDPDHRQWIGGFVQKVLRKGEINAKNVEIYEIDPGKRFFLRADGKEYIIRMWDFEPIMYDNSNQICGERVECSLYENLWNVATKSGGERLYYRNPIVTFAADIKWDNDVLEADYASS